MRLVVEYIRENIKKVLLVVVFVIILIILSIYTDKDNDKKIYVSDDYIYTKEYFEHYEGLFSKLPYINIKSKEVNEVNIDLIEKYYKIITLNKQFMIYKYYKNDTVLSLIISIHDIESPEYPSELFAYNISLNDGSLIDNNELEDMFNISSDDVSNIISNQLEEYHSYEVKKGYTTSDCDFNCYLYKVQAFPILDNCNYYVRNNNLYVYKQLIIENEFYYDIDSGFDLFNFKIK